MLVSDFLVKLRDTLDEGSSPQNWSTAMLTRAIDDVVMAAARRMIDKGQGHYEITLVLRGSDALQVTQNVWEYILPPRTSKIRRIFHLDSAPETPANWSAWNIDLSSSHETLELRKMDQNSRGPGWYFAAPNSFRVRGQAIAQDLLVRVAMYPPPVFRGTLGATDVSSNANEFYLPSPEQDGGVDSYLVDQREGAYVNALFSPTPTGANALTLGVPQRCIYSTANFDDSGTRKHLLQFQQSWATALVQNDIVETHVPIPDNLLRMIELQVLNRCFQRKRMLDDIRAIAEELRFEIGEFRDFIKQRDNHGPAFFRSSRTRVRRNDIDSDYLLETIWP